MDIVKKNLEKRKEYLQKIKTKVTLSLQKVQVEGTIRLCTSHKNPQYYLRTDPKDTKGKYIPQKDLAMVKKILQKEYNKKVVQSIDQEIKAIDTYFRLLPKKNMESIHETLHEARKKLVEPMFETDIQFVSKWENQKYIPKEIDDTVPLLFTAKGERVRSKSEIMIADFLYAEGIPYKYECPINLKGFGVIYPDFTILNVRERKIIYYEHFGKMDDPEYATKTVKKIKLYEQNGIHMGDTLIATWETKNCPLTPRDIRRVVQRIFEE